MTGITWNVLAAAFGDGLGEAPAVIDEIKDVLDYVNMDFFTNKDTI